MDNTFCTKCGSQLDENQKFCAHCGQKVGVNLDSDVSLSIAAFNENLGKKKRSRALKVGLGIGIPCVIIVISFIIFHVLTVLNGTYTCISSQSESYYTFDKGKYRYKSEDTRKKGTYEVSGNKIVLTDDDNEEDIYRRKGSYIYAEDSCYDEKIKSGAKVDQTLSKSASTNYEGTLLTIEIRLELSSDGTYKYTSTLSADLFSEDIQNIKGKYKKESGKLILMPDGEKTSNTYLIVKDILYYSVYKK